MNLSVFKPFFSFIEPAWLPRLTYGLTHFYNRVRSNIDWDSFSVIKPASKNLGEVLIGQIPIQSFRNELVKKLSYNGLIVSCNENFELAGVGAFSNIIPCFSWAYYAIDHQHVPFTNYARNADPLIILTLQKMVKVHNKGGSIYIHCKVGGSRSILIAALFLCISDESKKQQLLEAKNDLKIEDILTKIIKQLSISRPQINIDKIKLPLGIRIIKHYITYWKGTHPEPHLFNIPLQEEHGLSAYQALNIISQSDEYKFVWDQAYKNSYLFPTVKIFAESLYKYVERNQNQDFNIDQLIGLVSQEMEEDEIQIIKNLHQTYLAKEEYTRLLKNYSIFIQNLGLELLYKIFKSDLLFVEKTAWLEKISVYLKKPTAEQLAQYNKEIHSALTHTSLILKTIGAFMMLLGATVALVAIVSAFLVNGGFFAMALSTIGFIAFGAFQFAIGQLVYEHGASNEVAMASHVLINKIMEEECDNSDKKADSYCQGLFMTRNKPIIFPSLFSQQSA